MKVAHYRKPDSGSARFPEAQTMASEATLVRLSVAKVRSSISASAPTARRYCSASFRENRKASTVLGLSTLGVGIRWVNLRDVHDYAFVVMLEMEQEFFHL